MNIAFYDTFECNCAEKENLIRLEKACSSLSVGFITIRNNNIVSYPPALAGKHITQVPDVLCIISLHVNSPKTTNIPTYYSLWCPTQQYSPKQLSVLRNYDGYISCYGLRDELISNQLNISIVGHMNHTLHDPIMPIDIESTTKEDLKCFYVGVNWEATGLEVPSPRLRALKIIKMLERDNLVKIYGPAVFNGKEVWKGFSGYSGEIPFDGSSVITKIRETGVCLVLSSDAHFVEGICTNRLFEGLASGVPIICDKNPFIKTWFGDNVYYIDTSSTELAVNGIKGHLQQIIHNPDETLNKVQKCREIFVNNFMLDKQLKSVMDGIRISKTFTARRPQVIGMKWT